MNKKNLPLRHKISALLKLELTQKIIALILLGLLLFFPFSMAAMDLTQKAVQPPLLFPLTVLFSTAIHGFNFFLLTCILLYFLPISFILLSVSIFVKKIPQTLLYVFSGVATAIYLLASVSAALVYANTPRWFAALHPLVYTAFFIAAVFHIFLIAKGIVVYQKKDKAYEEYNTILKEQEEENILENNQAIERFRAKRAKLPKGSAEYVKIDKITKKYIANFKQHTRKTHIKTKITFILFIVIMTMLTVFVRINLKNYHSLLTQTINSTGSNLAQQVSAIYYFSDGLHAKISSFLEGIKATNESSPFQFKRVDIIITDQKEAIYLENIRNERSAGSFTVFAYTTATDMLKEIPASEKQISAADAFQYIKQYTSDTEQNKPFINSSNGTTVYVYPIIFPRKEGNRLIGFSKVSYITEILDRPYFQVQVFMFALSAFFVYVSVLITLFLADLIAKPIIFLAGSIRKTANTFRDMVSGTAEIDANRFVFNEEIKTNDELKTLSVEIKNMVSLIRGILPYISFHTLRNAEKNMGNRSYLRDLCFLFTDIRGFTSLCENMEAKEVTSMLNYYLDLETKIIFDNGGDVDKYVGDEVMAFFAGPRKEINACKAALEIRRAMGHAQLESIKAGKAAVSIGIGIHSGKVVFGPVGSKTRKDYTSIGDTVNLAARLEGANKEYGSKSIISESVYQGLNNDFICRELDFIAVKGKTEAVRIFEIMQQSDKLSLENIRELKNLFESGLQHYRNQNWTTAKQYFASCIERYNDNPAKVFLRRIEHYQLNPPKSNWKGVFVMNVK